MPPAIAGLSSGGPPLHAFGSNSIGITNGRRFQWKVRFQSKTPRGGDLAGPSGMYSNVRGSMPSMTGSATARGLSARWARSGGIHPNCGSQCASRKTSTGAVVAPTATVRARATPSRVGGTCQRTTRAAASAPRPPAASTATCAAGSLASSRTSSSCSSGGGVRSSAARSVRRSTQPCSLCAMTMSATLSSWAAMTRSSWAAICSLQPQGRVSRGLTGTPWHSSPTLCP